MSQPAPYNRLYSFSDFQTANPTRPLPASPLDAELNAIKATTDQVRQRLALIQRDDGAIANRSVVPESLSPGVLAMLGQRSYTPRGQWEPETEYEVDDVVDFNLGTYLALQDHTSALAFANDRQAGRWLLLANAALDGAGAAVDLLEGDGVEDTFTLSVNYQSSAGANVFVGGVAQIPDLDFTITANQLVFVVPPPAPAVPGRFNIMVRGTAVEAQLASSAAIQGAIDAQQFADEADADRVAAQAARVGAESARDAAAGSATSAGTSAGAASSDRALAQTARTEAQAARDAAQTARDAAQAAQVAAAGSAISAGSSASAASNDRALAQTARTEAQAARDAAQTARDAAAGSAMSAGTSATQAAASAAAAQAASPTALVGMVGMFPANAVSAPWLKLNGASLSRTTYPELWAYAQASGNLVAQGSKQAGNFGTGDGSTTFTLPDYRGEFPRFWDDGRGIDVGRGVGTAQADDIKSGSFDIMRASTSVAINRGAAGSMTRISGGGASTTIVTGTSSVSSYDVDRVTIGDGASETRPRNVAMLACIRYE
jgi:microcystin-dependent protein